MPEKYVQIVHDIYDEAGTKVRSGGAVMDGYRVGLYQGFALIADICLFF